VLRAAAVEKGNQPFVCGYPVEHELHDITSRDGTTTFTGLKTAIRSEDFRLGAYCREIP
jgi:hypothetical protein